MSDIKSKLSAVRTFFTTAIAQIGVLPTGVIAGILALVLIFVVWFAWGGITDAWNNHKLEKELQAARVDKQKALDDKAVAETRASELTGQLTSLEQQKNEIQNDYNIVFDRYQNLRKASDEALLEYQKAKRAKVIINGGADLSNRFRNLSDVLDGLDADTGAVPDR